MLRKTMGMSMPLKLSVERKAASRSRSSPLLFCGQLEGADRAGHGHGLRRHVRQSEELREHDRLSIQCHAGSILMKIRCNLAKLGNGRDGRRWRQNNKTRQK